MCSKKYFGATNLIKGISEKLTANIMLYGGQNACFPPKIRKKTNIIYSHHFYLTCTGSSSQCNLARKIKGISRLEKSKTISFCRRYNLTYRKHFLKIHEKTVWTKNEFGKLQDIWSIYKIILFTCNEQTKIYEIDSIYSSIKNNRYLGINLSQNCKNFTLKLWDFV